MSKEKTAPASQEPITSSPVPTVAMTPFKTNYNAWAFPVRYETNDKPSLTVPDQTMSVQQIVSRYQRGLPISGQKVPVYYGDDENYVDLDKMDLEEIHELIGRNRQTITQLRDKLKTRDTKTLEQRIDEYMNRRFPKRDEGGSDVKTT